MNNMSSLSCFIMWAVKKKTGDSGVDGSLVLGKLGMPQEGGAHVTTVHCVMNCSGEDMSIELSAAAGKSELSKNFSQLSNSHSEPVSHCHQ